MASEAGGGAGRSVGPLLYEVAYADTDAGGIVYHATYLAMAERSRNHVLRAVGLPVAEMKACFGVLFIVREIRTIFYRPALVGDVLALSSGIVSVTPVRALWGTTVTRGAELISRVEAEIAAFDPAAGGPCLVPSDLMNLLAHAPGLAPMRHAPRMKTGFR
ncbi:thioesterase family protein [Mesorhizobium sp. 1B3]|uniref:thioesterase family protein n=1 Tax=Mesorhizobium sp. 1B3 TaxID=3243599 RepID=UPI003D953684